jgi:hypothetical protein
MSTNVVVDLKKIQDILKKTINKRYQNWWLGFIHGSNYLLIVLHSSNSLLLDQFKAYSKKGCHSKLQTAQG